MPSIALVSTAVLRASLLAISRISCPSAAMVSAFWRRLREAAVQNTPHSSSAAPLPSVTQCATTVQVASALSAGVATTVTSGQRRAVRQAPMLEVPSKSSAAKLPLSARGSRLRNSACAPSAPALSSGTPVVTTGVPSSV